MNLNYSIFVSTSDNFEDCWAPFFKLFQKYWTDYNGNIYLNTERKDFSYPTLKVTPLKVADYYNKKNITWSECVIKAFDLIETDIILLFFEDIFINSFVKPDIIEKYVDIMIKEDIAFLDLGENHSEGAKTIYEDLYEVSQNANYRINTQPSLWNVKKMKKYLRKHESPWYFEIYGTKRSHYLKDKIWFAKNPKYALSFVEGIRRGKWDKDMVTKLFRENNIDVDFSIRGFYEREPKKRNYENLFSFNYLKNKILSESEIIFLKSKKYFYLKI